MQGNQTAASIHFQYRAMANNETQVYSDLRTAFPMRPFPKHAARAGRFMLLAEVWGIIATELCGRKVDYIEKWRTGQ